MLGVVLLSSALVGCGSSGSGGPAPFPTHAGNVFSIQYRNSTSAAITVWFIGSKPPCSKAQADLQNCDPGDVATQWASKWAAMSAAFEASGTAFSIVRTNGTSDPIAVANSVDLAAGEVLRVVPPIVAGTDPGNGSPYTRPEWYYTEGGTGQTSGTTTWVTRTGVSMPAPEKVLLSEFNVAAPLVKQIWYDLGAVDGVNANATMTYTGCTTAQQKACRTNIQAYDGTNDGCPYLMQVGSARVCPNPKFYPATLDAGLKPSWVVPSTSFTTADVSTTYSSYWTAAGSPSGAAMASAASGAAVDKKAYHLWWSTNPVAQGWLTYLQKNHSGSCDAYGWAYDEKRWVPANCDPNTQTCFEAANGNPADNQDVHPLVQCGYSADSYVNIDVLEVM